MDWISNQSPPVGPKLILYTIISNNTLTNRWIHVTITVPTYALYCIWKETFVLCSTLLTLIKHKKGENEHDQSILAESKTKQKKTYKIVTSDVMLCICGQYVDVPPAASVTLVFGDPQT